LTALACWGNRITSLQPLSGMPLTALNCAGNSVSSLDPLRGLPLGMLRCEACGLDTLEPLRGAPLTVLNCSENRLGNDALEALRGMRLTWLACMHTGVKNLAPLEGMPLTWLFCDGNQIEDVEPLRELPLTELSCRGNRIANLDPLKGGRLNTLRADDNLIASLEPLRGLPLTTFSCCWNRVTSLEPLRGMPVSCLLCGGNQLRDIGSFIKNPTKVFFFDCDTIPIKELEWIHQTWSRDLRFTPYVKNIEVLLALRTADVKRLKELASQFQGRRYLFVPKFVTWPEAKRICESLGGHLVTITSEEENEFVASLFPLGGSWFWIGLVVGKEKQTWITGEPLEFRAFVNVLQEQTPGPRVFSGRNWCFDVVPESHNCFMIEWNS
jgi:Leucine-rich repeat (LRR) protein